ncbi:MAG: hypothetical protein H6P99_3145, partial [Holophagaceae bacterium]|nr:hypothetical protein [Holophagaceae bacterium]
MLLLLERQKPPPGMASNAVAAGEAEAAAGHGEPHRLPRHLPDLGDRRLREQIAAVDVADEGNPVPVPLLQEPDVHPGRGLERVQAVDAGVDDQVQDGHDVAVGVLDHVG